MIYEVLSVARGRATVSFGGESSEAIDVGVGDVVILLSGTGHRCLAPTDDLVVVGAYPSSGTYNLCRNGKAEHIPPVSTPKVPRPETDWCLGRRGR